MTERIEKEEDFEVRQLTLVEIVKTRGEALEAIAKMTTKLRMGFPSGELTSKKAKKWDMERLLMRTFTDGQLVENEWLGQSGGGLHQEVDQDAAQGPGRGRESMAAGGATCRRTKVGVAA